MQCVIIVCCISVAIARPAVQDGPVLSATPNNGALLYYQALLKKMEPNEVTARAVNRVLRGGDPNDRVREYLRSRQVADTVALLETGAQALQCDWGVLRSREETLDPVIVGALRELSLLLELDARILAHDGEYRKALKRCLSMRGLGLHLSGGTLLMYESFLQMDLRALRCIQHILEAMPPDIDTLTWLQGHLAVQGSSATVGNALEVTRDYMAEYLYANPAEADRRRKQALSEATENGATEGLFSDLTNEEFLQGSLVSYDKYLYSVLRIIGSGMSYERKYAELEALRRTSISQAASDPPIIMTMFVEQIATAYGLQVHHAAYVSAITAAIEIYRVVAETGQLPEAPPSFLPPDPFSGTDFGYERTENGFILHCRSRDIFASERRYLDPDKPPRIGNKVQSYNFSLRGN